MIDDVLEKEVVVTEHDRRPQSSQQLFQEPHLFLQLSNARHF